MSDDPLDQLDYYTLLGVDPQASAGDIKRAFRQFARRYHPDRFPAHEGEKRARATVIYRRGSEAVQTLADPVAREAYHRLLRRGRVRMTSDDKEEALTARRRALSPQGADPHPIRSPQARAYYERAADAAKGRNWRAAWQAMKQALHLEPGNPLLEKRMRQIEAQLRP